MQRLIFAIAFALILLAAQVAPSSAVMLSASGTGQALIFPFFTVAKSPSTLGSRYSTLISIVNPTDRGKALRVQFHERKRGAIVHDLNVFLSAGDVWTGALAINTDGDTTLVTQDRSCRLPSASASFAFDPGDWFANGGPLAGEGHFVVLEMGTITRLSALEDAIGHLAVRPCNLPADAQLQAQLERPSGDMHGSATIINVLEGTAYSYDAMALDYWRDSALYAPPGSAAVSLLAATPPASTVIDRGIAHVSSWTSGADAVSAVLMAAQLESSTRSMQRSEARRTS